MSTGYKKCKLGNDLEFIDNLINEMLTILVEQASDDFWKILKYGSSDALSNTDYSISEQDKYDMVKQNADTTRIKIMKFNDDISVEAHSEIRIFNSAWSINNTNEYILAIGVEIISNNNIIILDVGKTTINVLLHEMNKIFNNAYIYKGIGKMSNTKTRGVINIFNSNYQGYQFTFNITSG